MISTSVELRFGGVRVVPGAVWGVPGGHRPLQGAFCVWGRVDVCVRVCVWEILLMQEHADSPGVVGWWVQGYQMWPGFGIFFWAFLSFREAFFSATFAACDLVHLNHPSIGPDSIFRSCFVTEASRRIYQRLWNQKLIWKRDCVQHLTAAVLSEWVSAAKPLCCFFFTPTVVSWCVLGKAMCSSSCWLLGALLLLLPSSTCIRQAAI